MADLTLQQALWLLHVADGRPVQVPGARDASASRGLVQLVSPRQAEVLRACRGLQQQAEACRLEARRVRRSGCLGAFVPPLRRRREAQAEALGKQADAYEAEARAHWTYLSSHDLLDLDLALLSPGGDGSLLSITDRGRDAVWDFIYSARFERAHVSEAAVAGRIEAFLRLRAGLLAQGFQPDPRVDLAAAVASRNCADVDRVMALNRLATAARWQSYDRLPLVGLLTGGEGEPEAVWERFWSGYQTLKASGCVGGYETRLAAMTLQRWGEGDEAACARLWEIARRLRYHGWSLGQSTDPVAARLAGLRLSPTQVVARVLRLVEELERGPWAMGPYLDLAAAVAAGNNLHRLAIRAETAQLMEALPRYHPFVDRYDLAMPATGEDSAPTLTAALLALLPGEVPGTLRRHQEATARIAAQVGADNAPPLALMLLDAACPDWCDLTQFTWEIASLLHLPEPGSAFASVSRMGAMYQRMAQRAEMSKPEGPAAGPG